MEPGASVKRELPVLHKGGRKEKRVTPDWGSLAPGPSQCLHLKKEVEQGGRTGLGEVLFVERKGPPC